MTNESYQHKVSRSYMHYAWVDTFYAVHPGMRNHTGGTMSLGRGVIHTKSFKQKLNTKSWTESEVVETIEYLTHNVWTELYMAAQGNELSSNIFFKTTCPQWNWRRMVVVYVVKSHDILMFGFSGLRIGYEVEISTYGIALRKIWWRITLPNLYEAPHFKKSISHNGMGTNLSFA